MGVGLVLRRRTNRLRDLFRFRKSANDMPLPRQTSAPGQAATTRQEKSGQEKKK